MAVRRLSARDRLAGVGVGILHGCVVCAALATAHFYVYVVATEPFWSAPAAFDGYRKTVALRLPQAMVLGGLAFVPGLGATLLGYRPPTGKVLRRAASVLGLSLLCAMLAILHGFVRPPFPLSLLPREAQLAIGENMLLVNAGLLVLVVALLWYWVSPVAEWCVLRSRQRTGHCPNCGYDLAGIAAGVCPECGSAIRGKRQARAVS